MYLFIYSTRIYFCLYVSHIIFQISYCLDDGSGEILVKDITRNIIMAILTVDTACPVLSIKGVWLAAAQEQSANEVFVSYHCYNKKNL